MTAADNDSPHAVRLIFEYEGPDIRLVSRQRLETTPPPGDRGEDLRATQGFWVEVRDAEHNVLYRRVLHDPVRYDAEVFSEDPDRSIARVPVETPRGTFAILVPDIEAADHVALFSGPLDRGAGPAPAPASETARFALRPGTDDVPDIGEAPNANQGPSTGRAPDTDQGPDADERGR
ncbi:hypothetical protein RND61_05765 [Streptomyces sp. TRM76323]|uniref:Uncharacterized protein n=1 Tax=Streptomyces tamarix TaxID=3078565 RepID=A0ABU3QFS2_9ACTN|nr:hypothetical protein [Streptomyces tamarix]MDT9681584.1 hypothetical protein [Streptomyces tamarix]